ncbi:MAG: phosphoribosylaminoimidazolesuccinocarboxamide synthase [Bdellovibrionales bacterium]|nr:phosphoribosylaminoimidazolesuccinocarboxamide synthase [Bdellovibrionales bacterium]
MVPRDAIAKQLAFTLGAIDVPGLGGKYEGKVRDCYTVGDRRVLIASDRLSAFDVVLTTIPFKGRMLTELAAYWFEQTSHIIRNHVLEYPHPNVVITREVEIIPVEVIVRNYLAGSAWRDYEAGRAISGIELPKGMKKAQQLDSPLITPSTKAAKGSHDTPISSDEVVSSGLVEKSLWEEVCAAALQLFTFGSKKAAERGLLLVDTKFEFGVLRSGTGRAELLLADEVLTQDSSRYWIADSYQERFDAGEDPLMLDKEFVRRWLIERGYMGDGTPPTIPDDFRVDVSLRYMDAYEKITGSTFTSEIGSPAAAIAEVLKEVR